MTASTNPDWCPETKPAPWPIAAQQRLVTAGQTLYHGTAIGYTTAGAWSKMVGTDATLVAAGWLDYEPADGVVDNSASAFTAEVFVRSGVRLMLGSGLAQGDEGKIVYAVYDNEFSLSSNSAARPVLGQLVEFVDSTHGWVFVDPRLSLFLTAIAADVGATYLHTPVADSAAVQGIAAADRRDGMIVVKLDTYDIWEFAAGSSTAADAWALVPTAGTGRWIRRAPSLTDLSTAGSATLGAVLVGIRDVAAIITATTVEGALAELAVLGHAAPAMQAGNATLVSGTVTVNTGITVATASEVIPVAIGAITGSTNFAGLRELKASRVNGAPSTGTIVLEAVGSDGAKDVDAAGAIRFVILTPQ